MNYADFGLGTWHPRGGMYTVIEGMVSLAESLGVQFEINSSYTTFNLNQQEIDLAFRATNLPPDNMVAVKLFPYQHVLVASPEYLSTYGIPEQVSDLEHHQCLTTLHQKYWPLKNQEILVNGWISTNENHLLKK